MTRLLCVGDLHLGAGTDYGREPGDRLRDQEQVWTRCLEQAAEHDVDAVLFAGDAFHRRRPTPAELLAWQRPLRAFLAEHSIDFLVIAGNHDVEAAELPNALELFEPIVDVHSRPGTWNTRDCTVCTLPWAPVSRLVAARNGGDRDLLNQEAAGYLLSTARELRARVPAGQPAVLLMHWSISGASTPTGVQTDDFREVVVDADKLAGLGFDTIVAGHIHKPQSINGGPAFYVGSPAPVDFGEAASEHGVFLLETTEPQIEFLPIESRPFVTLDYDPDRGFLLPVTDAVVRVRYIATEEQARRIDHAEISRALYAAGAHKVYAIQADIVREQRARVDGVDEDLAPLAAVDAWISANEISTVDSAALVDLTAGYLEAVA